jgi:hypothetical protein
MQHSRNWACAFIVGALVFVLVIGTAVRSLRAADEEKKPVEKTDAAAASKPGEPDMESEMEAMNKALQKITRDLKNPKKVESTLAAVTDLQLRTINCKAMMPGGAATRPAEEVKGYNTEYRNQMADVLRATCDLEQQILKGETDKAAATVKSLRGLEKKGHSVYQPPKEEK